ncbi:MAG: nickel transporter [Thiohalocapsa sp.]|nr:nickel transporter [Thiohalocapsa sp.]
MKLVPVIDLRAALAVRARAGDRSHYAPLATPLCPDGDALALALLLVSRFRADTLYIADLDAITGTGGNRALIERIAAALPETTLWVDAGIGDRDALLQASLQPNLRPVVGSETLPDADLLRDPACASAVLSLDQYRGRLLAPAGLEAHLDGWHGDVVLMGLDRVGIGGGPDLARLARYRRRLPRCRLYAAGGVRDAGDLSRLADAGAAGALVATALHDGAISADDVAAFA